jgi:hypothetical protein
MERLTIRGMLESSCAEIPGNVIETILGMGAGVIQTIKKLMQRVENAIGVLPGQIRGLREKRRAGRLDEATSLEELEVHLSELVKLRDDLKHTPCTAKGYGWYSNEQFGREHPDDALPALIQLTRVKDATERYQGACVRYWTCGHKHERRSHMHVSVLVAVPPRLVVDIHATLPQQLPRQPIAVWQARLHSAAGHLSVAWHRNF